MKFTEFESIMNERGVFSLADIARTLKTTPQAVSNWKARDQVPYHIVSKINSINNPSLAAPNFNYNDSDEKDTMSIFDIFVTLSEHLKVIFLVTFIFSFITFTYVKFVQKPVYLSWATILLPQNNTSSSSFAGLASQFGINVPTQSQTDLSSPSLLPELLRSDVFAEKLLEEKFYTKEKDNESTLLSILTKQEQFNQYNREAFIAKGTSLVKSMIVFSQDKLSGISTLQVKASEPQFARDLANVILFELEKINLYYKNTAVNEKLKFIEIRINSVQKELNNSEKQLKRFREQNQQLSSPSLQLESERLNREVEVQKGIYLTLKQQFELAKIDEIQQASVLQILDKPKIPLDPMNKNLVISTIISASLGLFLSIFIGFFRSYIRYSNKNDRKKIRRMRGFIRKKGKDIVLDYRISGIVFLSLLIGLPYYIGYESAEPVFLNRYSKNLFFLIIFYFGALLFSFIMLIYTYRAKKNLNEKN
tara:strand:- start:12516 stop:13949 length:1434 start_codon:yes stop_codon:yes gene_type:complete